MKAHPKKPQPWAKCMKCGMFYDDEMINKKCLSCKGTVRSELRPDTWHECESCQATGIQAEAPCHSCNGYGWYFKDNLKMK